MLKTYNRIVYNELGQYLPNLRISQDIQGLAHASNIIEVYLIAPSDSVIKVGFRQDNKNEIDYQQVYFRRFEELEGVTYTVFEHQILAHTLASITPVRAGQIQVGFREYENEVITVDNEEVTVTKFIKPYALVDLSVHRQLTQATDDIIDETMTTQILQEFATLLARVYDVEQSVLNDLVRKAFAENYDLVSVAGNLDLVNKSINMVVQELQSGGTTLTKHLTYDQLEKSLRVLADKVVEGADRKFVTALQKTWLNEFNGLNGFLKMVNGLLDLSAIPIAEFEFEGRLTSVNQDDNQSVQGNKVTQVVGNRTDATLNIHELRANSAKLKTAIGGEYNPNADDSLVHKKYVDTRDQVILDLAKTDSTNKVSTHNLDATAHPFLTGKVEDLEREVERIDSRGRAYGEIPYLTTVLQGFTVGQRNTAILNAILAFSWTPSDYTPTNGDLVYDEGQGNGQGFHEWEFNGTNWVDNGVIGFAKATNSIFGQIKGDPTKIDILNGQVIKIIADEAVRDQHGNIIDDHYATLADLDFLKTAWGWKSENFGTVTPSTNVRFTQDLVNPLTKYLDQYDFIHVRILQPTPSRSFSYLGDTPIAYNQSFTVSSMAELDNPQNYLDPLTVNLGWVVRLLRIENDEPFYKFYEVVGSDGEGTILHSLAFLPKDIRSYTDGKINLVGTTTYLLRDGVNAQFITNISGAVFKVEGYSVNPIDSSKVDHKGEPLSTFLDGVEDDIEAVDTKIGTSIVTHNTSPSAHTDLLFNVLANASNTAQGKVDAHNTNPTAHAGIRADITSLEEDVNTAKGNIQTLQEDLTTAQGDINGLSANKADTTYVQEIEVLAKKNEAEVNTLKEVQNKQDDGISQDYTHHENIQLGKDVLSSPIKAVAKGETIPPLVNLVTNGDFSSGTTGWTPLNATNDVVGGVLKNTANGTSNIARTRQLSVNTNINEVIYATVRFRVTNADARLIYNRSGSGSNSNITLINNPIANQWYVTSGTVTKVSNDTVIDIYHQYVDASTALNKVMEVDYVVYLSLTSIFGAGNEPTASQFEVILDKLGLKDTYFTQTQLTNALMAMRLKTTNEDGSKTTEMYLNANQIGNKVQSGVADTIELINGKWNFINRIDPILLTALTTPIITPIETSNFAKIYPKGTVQITHGILLNANMHTNGKVNAIYPNRLIASIEKIYKLNANGTQTELDVSLASISVDKQSFTHPNLANGDIVIFTYFVEGTYAKGDVTVKAFKDQLVVADTANGKFYTWKPIPTNGVFMGIEFTEVL